MPSINGAFLSLSLSLSYSLLIQNANVADSTSLSSALLRSNLVEFSWVDILLSSRAYLYLAFESSGPFARFANCTIASFYALHKKERKRERERDSPLFPIRDGGLSPYILGSVDSRKMRRTLTPCAVESGRRRRRVKDSLSLSLSLTPRGTHGRTRAPLLIYIGRLAYFVIYC